MTVGFVTRRTPRKLGIFMSSILSSIIGLMFLFSFVKENEILQTVLIVAARLTASYVFCFFNLFESEVLPIEIRNTSFSLVDGCGQVSRIIVPYIIYIMTNLKIPPIIAFSVVLVVFCGLPVLLLKQTLTKDTGDEAKSKKS